MDLFGDETPRSPAPARRASQPVRPAAVAQPLRELAAGLPPALYLGTSSWSFPGWNGLVWDGDFTAAALSQHGLTAYASHPLMRTVSLDRSFYRPLTASQYAAHASQVPDHFRFVVKAPSLVTDAVLRGTSGRGTRANPAFLRADLATSEFIEPALQGLGRKTGALVFQLSPLPVEWLTQVPALLDRLGAMLAALPALSPRAPGAVIAVEVRDPELLTPAFARLLKAAGATYCLGLHPRMPAADAQLPMLRALWPSPLVCRWSLNRTQGAQGYERAKAAYAPFDSLVDPDPATRAVLARVIAGTTGAGMAAYITVNNKAEGSAPLSVIALAQALQAA